MLGLDSGLDKDEKGNWMDDTTTMEFELFEMQDLIIRKDERIETLELELKHLRARVALLDGRLVKTLGQR